MRWIQLKFLPATIYHYGYTLFIFPPWHWIHSSQNFRETIRCAPSPAFGKTRAAFVEDRARPLRSKNGFAMTTTRGECVNLTMILSRTSGATKSWRVISILPWCYDGSFPYFAMTWCPPNWVRDIYFGCYCAYCQTRYFSTRCFIYSVSQPIYFGHILEATDDIITYYHASLWANMIASKCKNLMVLPEIAWYFYAPLHRSPAAD